jgi:glycosyltransferase involved in cell wall biosynthesis
MKVFLLTTQAVAPPWNGCDKNLARTLLAGDTGVEYSFVGDRADLGSPSAPYEPATPARRGHWPSKGEKARLFARLLVHPPRVDLVHAIITFRRGAVSPWAASLLPLLQRNPLVITCPSGSFLPRRLLQRARVVVALSRRTEQALRGLGVPAVRHIPPGVDLVRFSPAPREVGLRTLGIDEGPLVLFAGHLDHGGGLEAAIEVVARLRRRVPAVRLLCATRTRPHQDAAALRAGLHRLAGSLGLHDALVELGPSADMRAALLACSAVVFQPDVMGMKADYPLTLLEALACGRPVVVGGTSPLPELADGDPAVTIADAGDSATVDHLERLIVDSEFAAVSSSAARSLAERRFGAEAMVAAYGDLYSTLR